MYQVTAGQDPHRLVSIANVRGVYLDSIFTHVSVSAGLPLPPRQLSWVLLLFPPELDKHHILFISSPC